MKKWVSVLGLVALLAAGMFFGPRAAADNTTFELSTPQDTRGWSFHQRIVGGGGGSLTGGVEHTVGPLIPQAQGAAPGTTLSAPLSSGAVTMRVGSNPDSINEYRHNFFDGAKLTDIAQLSYLHVVTNRQGSATAPGLFLRVATGEPADPFHTLVYEPYRKRGVCCQDPVVVGKWMPEDAHSGIWWRSTPPAETDRSLAQYQAEFPNARVRTDVPGGGLAMFVGGGGSNWPNFVGAVDHLVAKRSDSNAERKWNFEAETVPVRSTANSFWFYTAPERTRFMAGPSHPGSGFGSVEFSVGPNGKDTVEARNADLDQVNLSSISELTYSTFVPDSLRASDQCPGGEAPYLSIDVLRAPQADSGQTPQRLYFHPCKNGTVAAGKWQLWDVAQRGRFTWSESSALHTTRASDPALSRGVSCSAGRCEGTLQQYRDFYDGTETVANRRGEGGSLRTGAGGPEASHPTGMAGWSNFVGNVDHVARAAGNHRSYDFDIDPPPTTTTPPTTSAPSGGSGGSGGTDTGAGRGTTTTTTAAPGGTTTTTAPSEQAPREAGERLHGSDRIATAVAVSQRAFPDGSAGAVVLARSDLFPDALAAAPVAARNSGPLLLTRSSDLDSRVRDEIRRVLPSGGTVHLAGGLAALTAAVEDELRASGFTVIRHSGRNRFETATLLAERVADPTSALLVTGTNFPDALSAGAAAAGTRGVVLLTNGTTVPRETRAYLEARPGLRRVAIGGAAAAAEPTADRVIVGRDRFETARRVAEEFYPSPVYIGLTSGLEFPDALAAGPLSGKTPGPLLLTSPTELPASVKDYLTSNRSSIRSLVVYGGERAVSPAVEDEARRLAA